MYFVKQNLDRHISLLSKFEKLPESEKKHTQKQA